MKKLFALLLAVMMVFSLATTAFALENITNGKVEDKGTITISGIASGYHYSVYKMLHLYTYDNKDGAYTYKVESNWAGFFAEGEEGLNYVDIDKNGFVTWKVANTLAPEFAQKALEYAKKHGIAAEASASSSNTELVFQNLTLGYYLVDTSMGVMCGLTTTKPNASIASKNGVPTVEKRVQEDSNVGTDTSEYGETNSADIGQIVKFDITITTQAGAHNYVYHDQMDDSLRYYADAAQGYEMVVRYHDPDTNVTDILTAGRDYTVVFYDDGNDNCTYKKSNENTEENWKCTFEVVFAQKFLNENVAANDKLYITYFAKLMDDAVIGEDGNHNTGAVTYGDGHGSETDETTTYTYGFDIFKTDAALKPLTGAKFQLLDSQKNVITVVYNPAKNHYRRATQVLEGEQACENNEITISNVNGLVRVVGLDNGDYYLRETKSPDGYTLLTEDVGFTISGHNLYATQNTDGSVGVGSSVHVENNKGITMPETGAMGTTMFITFGMFVVLGTGILLVTKKRMSMIED